MTGIYLPSISSQYNYAIEFWSQSCFLVSANESKVP